MTKDIQVAFGVDVDAVAGWLGSYGGEDSPVRHLPRPVRGRSRRPRACIRLFEKYGLQDHLVHPGPLDRDVPGRRPG